jgi:hypothetical protein
MPLVSVPISAIKDVCEPNLATIEKSNHRNKDAEKHLHKHLFEVRLRYKFEDIYRYRELDQVSRESLNSSVNQSKISSRSLLSSVRTSRVNLKSLKSSANRGRKSDNLFLPLAQKLNRLDSPGNSRNSNQHSKIKTIGSPENHRNSSTYIVPGHLMPKYEKTRPGSSQAMVDRFIKKS